MSDRDRTSPEDSPEALVHALRAGAPGSFAALVGRFQKPLYQYLRLRARSAGDAEEILHETFVRAWRHLDRYDDRWRVSTWLYTIARRQTASFYRRRVDEPSSDEPALTERTYGDSNKFQQVAMTWRKLAVPVIAAVHGVCFGGGLQIASGADIRIVHPETRMSVMEMKWGLVPDMGGYALWRGLVRDDALRELVYTNRIFNGAEAQTLGFATYNDEDPLARATAIAREIANKNPGAIRAAKRLQAGMMERDTDAILLEESIEQHAIMRTPNQIEAVMAEMQKRAPKFEDI